MRFVGLMDGVGRLKERSVWGVSFNDDDDGIFLVGIVYLVVTLVRERWMYSSPRIFPPLKYTRKLPQRKPVIDI